MLSQNNSGQLSLFSDKIAVDKNFNQSVVYHQNSLLYNFDFFESYGMSAADVLPMILFLKKRIYDQPDSNFIFTIKDYSDFLNISTESLKKYYNKIKPIKGKSNMIEHILDTLLRNNLIGKRKYIINKNDEDFKVDDLSGIQIITSYQKLTKKDNPKLSGRQKYYTASLNPIIINNMGNFIYYLSASDWQNIRRRFNNTNPNYVSLYNKLCFLFNELSRGGNSTVQQPTFDELAFILEYNQPSYTPRKVKQLISTAITKLLEYPSLVSMGFEWLPNGKNLYKPHFFIKNKENKSLNESILDKFKRLDNFLISQLQEQNILPFSDYIDANAFLQKNGYSVLNKAYEKCFNKTLDAIPNRDIITLFIERLSYIDKNNNIYVSSLARDLNHNNKPLLSQSYYAHSKIKYLFPLA